MLKKYILYLLQFCIIILTLQSDALEWRDDIEGSKAQDIMSFQREIELHIIRVEFLGMELAKLHPGIFWGIDKKKLRKFLRIHDRQKIEPPDIEVITLNPRDYRFFLLDLWNMRGKNMKDFSGEEYNYNRRVIDDLNYADREKALTFFIEHKMVHAGSNQLTDAANKFLLIEKIADVVDRGMYQDARAEFGKKMLPASEFLKDDFDRKLAKSLEEHYHEIINGHFGTIQNSKLKMRKNCAALVMSIMNDIAHTSKAKPAI
ncbi:MAG: hypothetical protein ISR65_02430 [Bacteriovoracaceae bacterium]|nr:hypothetical protein [Bacteriovoracaceae bacterium]